MSFTVWDLIFAALIVAVALVVLIFRDRRHDQLKDEELIRTWRERE